MSSEYSKHCPSCQSKSDGGGSYGDRHRGRSRHDMNGNRHRNQVPRMGFRRRDGVTMGWGREGGVRLDAPPMIRRERVPTNTMEERMGGMNLISPGGRPPPPRGPRRPPDRPHGPIGPLGHPGIPGPSPYIGYGPPYGGPIPGDGISVIDDMFPPYQGPNPYGRFPPHVYPRRYPQLSPHASPPGSPRGPRGPRPRLRADPRARPPFQQAEQTPNHHPGPRPRCNSIQSGEDRDPNVLAPGRPRTAEQAMRNYRPPYVESFASGLGEDQEGDRYSEHEEAVDEDGHSHGDGHGQEIGHHGYWYESDDYDDGYGDEDERYVY